MIDMGVFIVSCVAAVVAGTVGGWVIYGRLVE